MAQEQNETDGGGVGTAQDSLTVTDNRTGDTYELEITDGTVKAMDLRQIKVSEDDFGMMTYDPGFTNTASCRSSVVLHRRRGGRARVPRLSHRGPLRARHLPRGRVPAHPRRAPHPAAARRLGSRGDPPHLRAREHQEVRRGLSLRRPPHGHAARHGRRPVHLLPGREGDRRPRGAAHGGGPPDRQGAHPGRVRLPPQPRAALHLSGQRPQLRRQLPLDAVQDDRDEVRARPSPDQGAGHALHPPRRPRAELLDERCPRRGLLPGGPLLGRGRGCGGALRAAARRRERGRAADARPDRDGWTTSRTSSRA